MGPSKMKTVMRAGRQTNEIRPGRINSAPRRVGPVPCTDRTDPLGLIRRQDGEMYSVFCEDLQRSRIYRRFRKPHARWIALKSMLEVLNTPGDLSYDVPLVGEWKNHVIVWLGQRRSVT